MQHRGCWRFKSEITSVSTEAAIVSKAFRVTAATDLVIGLVEISEAGNQIALFISLESRPRDHIEHAVCTVSVVCVIASSLHFHVIDILGIKLRPDIAGNICVWDRD